MKLSIPVFRLPALAAAALLVVAGCAYVDPAARNPGRAGDQTRAETIGAGRRLAAKLFASEGFKTRYAAKRAEKPAGALPTLQLDYFKSGEPGTRDPAPATDFLRLDLQEALAESGWFALSSDRDACDYVMDGTYASVRDAGRVSHRVTLRLKDLRTGELVWTASDEIAKE